MFLAIFVVFNLMISEGGWTVAYFNAFKQLK